MTLIFMLTAIIVVQRLGELALARRNACWARARGAKEYGARHYPLFIVLHSAWLVGFNLEWFVLRPPLPSIWPMAAVLLLLAQVLRYWAIAALGKRWNTRILVVPGLAPVSSGPYRLLRHPNYVAVCLEIAAVPALIGAWYSALFFSLCNALLLFTLRIPAEERALRR